MATRKVLRLRLLRERGGFEGRDLSAVGDSGGNKVEGSERGPAICRRSRLAEEGNEGVDGGPRGGREICDT